MREIKFRAWFHNGEKECEGMMLNNVQFAKSGDDSDDWICVSIVDNSEDVPAPFYFGDSQWAQNPFPRQMFILMQFTGLVDKQGKEIYEGDVLLIPNYPSETNPNGEPDIGVVEFAGGAFGWRYLDRHRKPYGHLESFLSWEGEMDTLQEEEVIGNRYENPELREVT